MYALRKFDIETDKVIKMTKLNYIMVSAALIWIGFTSAISFMEAWIKFKAPMVTLPIGLGIGRLVFSALNKVEWVLAFIIAVVFIYQFVALNKNNLHAIIDLWFTFVVVLVILVLETFWLLPKLDKRASAIIAGNSLPASSLHIYFIGAECIKISLLIYFSIQFFLLKHV